MTALVIGCGVSGLSSGIRLLEAGIPTEIWTREPALKTTSSVAAAFWYPYKVYPAELILTWAEATYNELSRLADTPSSGVTMRESLEIFPDSTPDPWWSGIVSSFRPATADELPVGYADGCAFYSPIAEMPIYLTYLQQRFEELGGKVQLRPVDSIAQVLDYHDAVVNCAGLGARQLIGDPTMIPIRGQIVRVSQVGVERLLIDERNSDGLTYIVPRSNDCVLGGTSESGAESTEPQALTAADILTRCISREPRLVDAMVLEHRVGLRPGRPAVRVEIDPNVSKTLLVHNYGHGGAGVTLSWGCADRVTELVLRHR